MPYVGDRLAPLFDTGPLDRALVRMANEGGDELHDLVVMNTPIDGGNLRSSWYRTPAVEEGRTRRAWRSWVRTEVEYAPYVEWGTGLFGPEHRKYLIEPKEPGRMLSWVSGGRRFFAHRVWHPGSPGQYMMASAAARLEATLPSRLQPELERWAHEQEALGG